MDIEISHIYKSKRKTLSISFKNGKYIIKAPYFLSDEQIYEFVESNKERIKRLKIKWLEHQKKIVKKEFVNGEKFLYLGSEYPLKIIENAQSEKALIFDKKSFILNTSDPKVIRFLMESFYIETAKKYICARLNELAEKLQLKYTKCGITKAKTRWGSCSYKNSINFSYKLIMAPPMIIDYVIIHELVHILHKNHSTEFWKSIEKILPDYKERKKWLKENGGKLRI